MSLFPPSFYEADASSFTPLFRLLDDFDSYTRQTGGNQHGRRPGASPWQPKFDVRETDEAYELHGELPGMNKDTVHIEFPELQTMTVRGKAERTYSAANPAAGQIEDATEKPVITEGGEGSQASHKANLQDESGAKTENAGEKPENKLESSKYKYWFTERNVGEFFRIFTFPSPVDHDSVTAGFKDGILTVSVPKLKKPESRRITIN
jgi:HSP20 family molecular chaperone IbpA